MRKKIDNFNCEKLIPETYKDLKFLLESRKEENVELIDQNVKKIINDVNLIK